MHLRLIKIQGIDSQTQTSSETAGSPSEARKEVAPIPPSLTVKSRLQGQEKACISACKFLDQIYCMLRQ